MEAGVRNGAGTRDRILNEFVELVSERGYHATSIADVATAAGVSKGALLHHFGNKDGLLNVAGIEYIERRHVELSYAFAHLDDPADRFAAIVYTTMLAARDDRAASRTFGREFTIFQTDPRLQEVRDARGRFVAMVADAINDCMDAGLLRHEEPTMVLLQLYGMVNWTWTWYRPDGRLSAEEIAAQFTRTLLSGLAPRVRDPEPEFDGDRVVELLLEARRLPQRAAA